MYQVALYIIWVCSEPSGAVGNMIAGYDANACVALSAACASTLDSIPQLSAIPSQMLSGLTVADICPCSCAGNFNQRNIKYCFEKLQNWDIFSIAIFILLDKQNILIAQTKLQNVWNWWFSLPEII